MPLPASKLFELRNGCLAIGSSIRTLHLAPFLCLFFSDVVANSSVSIYYHVAVRSGVGTSALRLPESMDVGRQDVEAAQVHSARREAKSFARRWSEVESMPAVGPTFR